MEKTTKLYQENVYLKECRSKVLGVFTDPKEIAARGGKELKDSVCVILDQTVFFPEGGGQPCDTGDLSGLTSGSGFCPVLYVFEDEGIVCHQLLPPADAPISAGSEVICRLDWTRRFSNMQRHCGEHILSAVFYELYGGVNRGFHMGEDYMTIDIRLEENTEITELTDEQMLTAEWEANRMIWEDLPVSIRHFEKKEDAEGIPMRKALAIDEDITLVCVGDESRASGCVACCGTHPRTTGPVGLIKLYRWENYKGMIRITFDAGDQALLHCRREAEMIRSLCRQYSAEPAALTEKIAAAEQKNKNTRQELHSLKKIYLEEHAAEIVRALAESPKALLREYPVLKIDDLTALGRLLPKELTGLVLLVSPSENALYLQSGGSPDCGKIVRDNAGVWRGKGGGRPDNARALFPARQDLDCFIDYLFKAF